MVRLPRNRENLGVCAVTSRPEVVPLFVSEFRRIVREKYSDSEVGCCFGELVGADEY